MGSVADNGPPLLGGGTAFSPRQQKSTSSTIAAAAAAADGKALVRELLTASAERDSASDNSVTKHQDSDDGNLPEGFEMPLSIAPNASATASVGAPAAVTTATETAPLPVSEAARAPRSPPARSTLLHQIHSNAKFLSDDIFRMAPMLAAFRESERAHQESTNVSRNRSSSLHDGRQKSSKPSSSLSKSHEYAPWDPRDRSRAGRRRGAKGAPSGSPLSSRRDGECGFGASGRPGRRSLPEGWVWWRS